MRIFILARVKPCKTLFGSEFAVEIISKLFNTNIGGAKNDEYIIVDHSGKRKVCKVVSLAVSNTNQYPNLPQQIGVSFLSYDEALSTLKLIIDEPIKISLENYKLHSIFLILPQHEREFLIKLIEKHNINPFNEISPKDQRTVNIWRESHINTSVAGVKGYVPVFAPIAHSDYVPFPDYEIKGYDVVGVHFKNDDGISRQVILKRILKKELPYEPKGENGTDKIELVKYVFNGEDAVYVVVNGGIVGNIARTDLPFLLKNFASHEIHGASFMPYDDGTHGLTLSIKFKKTDITPLSLQEELLQETAIKEKEMYNKKPYARKRRKYD